VVVLPHLILVAGQHVHKSFRKGILRLFVNRHLRIRWFLGGCCRFVGFGGSGGGRRDAGGAGIVIMLVVCFALVDGGKLFISEGVSRLLGMGLGREFGEFVFILVGRFVIGNATG